jgi:glycosyltransferase involved in cell wall biosynthesis
MKIPRVSVLMSVYNSERYLRDAIDSILAQTFTNFEFIILDDGSTDSTWAMLEDYSQGDHRVIARRFDETRGLTDRLNMAIQMAHGEYVARMDADDVSLPQRLERQVDYLERNIEVGLVGTQMNIIDDRGAFRRIYEVPYSHSQIVWALMFGRSFAHPSVMIRKALLHEVGGYNLSFRVAQDHELWVRLLWLTRFANLPDVLMSYRSHPLAASRQKSNTQRNNVLLARQRLMSDVLDREMPIAVIRWIQQSQMQNSHLSKEKAETVLLLILELFDALKDKKLFITEELSEVRADLIENITLVSRFLIKPNQRYPETKPLTLCLRLIPFIPKAIRGFVRDILPSRCVPTRLVSDKERKRALRKNH